MTVREMLHKNSPARIFESVWSGYTYLYYRLYAWNLKTWGASDIPHFNAMCGVAFMSGFNILTLTMLIGTVAGVDAVFHIKKYQLAAGAVIWLLINYNALVRGGKYKCIAARFSKENRSTRRRHMFFCWLYVFLSFAAAFISARYAAPIRL